MINFLVILIVIGSALQLWSMKHGLDGVSHVYNPSKSIVEPEEVFQILSTVTNTSLRFISFLEVRESIPPEIEKVPGMEEKYSLFLMPRQCFHHITDVKALKRGCYYLSGALIKGGDFLGISENFLSVPQRREVLVIPPLYSEFRLKDTVGGFLGDISVNRFIMEDPVLTMGFREYTGREPMKMISWSQSAKNRRLIVKKYDYTLELVVTVILNVECHVDKETAPVIEDCFAIARTVCEYLEEKHIKYSFATNANITGTISTWDSIPDGLGSAHLMKILEGLARASYGYVRPFKSILNKAYKNTEQGRSHIIITPKLTDDYRHSISKLRDFTGMQVLVLTPGEEVIL